VKRLMLFTLTGALLAAFTSNASAGDKDHGERHAVSRYDQRSNSRNHDARDRYDDRHEHVYVERSRYFGTRDVVVVRNYYRPYYRPLPPGVRRVYVRNGYLPYGWERRMVAVPVYVERELVPLPYGYSRGIIDGQIVVHNQRGLIVDVAVLF
jgi:hypothetical protein